MRKVCAVVVTFNRVEMLRSCIGSLLRQSRLAGVIVVDNCSTDGTPDYLRSLESGHFHVFRLNENSGGAGGFHFGLRKAVELGYDCSWLMDDDVVPRDDALDALLDAAAVLNWEFGYLCSKVVSDQGSVINIPIPEMSSNEAGCPRWADALEHAMVRVRRATFVSLLINNAMLLRYGLPLKEMFIWGDDSEFTMRLSARHACYMAGRSVVVHRRRNNRSLSIYSEEYPDRIRLYFYFYRNAVYNIRKYEKSFFGRAFSLLRLISAVLLMPFRARDNVPLRIAVVARGVAAGLRFTPRIEMP